VVVTTRSLIQQSIPSVIHVEIFPLTLFLSIEGRSAKIMEEGAHETGTPIVIS